MLEMARQPTGSGVPTTEAELDVDWAELAMEDTVPRGDEGAGCSSSTPQPSTIGPVAPTMATQPRASGDRQGAPFVSSTPVKVLKDPQH